MEEVEVDILLPFCKYFLQGFLDCSSFRTAEESIQRTREINSSIMVKGGQNLISKCIHSSNNPTIYCKITFKIVKPGLLSSVMLNTVQVFLPVVHVILKGSVTVVAVVPLPHGASYILLKKR